jgi:hypothetical protein
MSADEGADELLSRIFIQTAILLTHDVAAKVENSCQLFRHKLFPFSL